LIAARAALRPPKAKSKSKAAHLKIARPARSGAETRARILAVAMNEFSRKGYNGARVDGICRAARINPRMIYHYFGGKAALYVACLERVLGDLRREELKLDVEHVSPFDGVLQLFDFIHTHFGMHPEIISLLNGENLLHAEFLRRSTIVPAISSPVLDLIARLLRRGAADGTLRPGIDPLQLYVAMVALSSYHRSNAYTLSHIFKTDLLDDVWRAAQLQQAKTMLASFVRAPAG
jgi:AcrR family transcriptional regulator